MRLFVSLPLPPEVRTHLASALAGVRTSDVGQWHITLAFLGEVDDAAVLEPGLRAASAGHPPLTMRLRGGGSFPGVLWAGVAGDVAGLTALAADVQRACHDAGVLLERRRYRPHVTVARRPSDPHRLDGYEGPQWTASQVHLVRSHLGASARHEVVQRFDLRR